MGRVVETRTAAANGSVQLGGAYRSGIYYVEAVQGSEKAKVKLIKQAQ